MSDWLVNYRGETLTFSIDDEDDEHVAAAAPWCIQRTGTQLGFYVGARRGSRRPDGKQRLLLLHRYLLGLGSGSTEVDHVNRNTLDNRRANLRPATSSLNKYNTARRRHNISGYPGVSHCRMTGRWRVRVGQLWLGRYASYRKAVAIAAQARADAIVRESLKVDQ